MAIVALTALLGVVGSHIAVELHLSQLRAKRDQLNSANIRLAVSHRNAVAELATIDARVIQLKASTDGLPRLRGEIDHLNRTRSHLDGLKEDNQLLQERLYALRQPVEAAPTPIPTPISPGTLIYPSTLAFGGFDTPEAALQSAYWSQFAGRFDQWTNALTKSLAGIMATTDPTQRIAFELQAARTAHFFRGMQVLARRNVATNVVELQIRLHFEPAAGGLSRDYPPDVSVSRLILEENQWRVSVGNQAPGKLDDWDGDDRVIRYTR